MNHYSLFQFVPFPIQKIKKTLNAFACRFPVKISSKQTFSLKPFDRNEKKCTLRTSEIWTENGHQQLFLLHHHRYKQLHIHKSHQLPFVTFATPKNVNFRIFIQAKLGKARIWEQQINQVLKTWRGKALTWNAITA